MGHLLENDEAVDQLANDAMFDETQREEEIQALEVAINYLSNPLLRHILLKIVDLIK